MSINLIRVINQQTLVRSILIDKIDRSQGNFSGYANRAKQKVYVPYSNPLDTAVKGYVDLTPTDEVLLSADAGTIKKLASAGKVATAVVSSALIAAPVISAADEDNVDIDITGTTFFSVAPDRVYVHLTNLAGATQIIRDENFDTWSNTAIKILFGVVTIGTPTAGWKVKVFANSKFSNEFTMTST
jgi:hypothetical protein